eukprot:694545-Prorocentrum_minimum.AAC.6
MANNNNTPITRADPFVRKCVAKVFLFTHRVDAFRDAFQRAGIPAIANDQLATEDAPFENPYARVGREYMWDT